MSGNVKGDKISNKMLFFFLQCLAAELNIALCARLGIISSCYQKPIIEDKIEEV